MFWGLFLTLHDLTLFSDSLTLSLSLSLFFSLSLRPCTPIFDLLENRYGERWLEEQRQLQRLRLEKMVCFFSKGVA